MNPFRPEPARPSAKLPSGDIEARLRAGAPAFAPAPPPELRARILAALQASPRPAAVPARVPDPRTARHGTWLAAAAALFVLGSAWWLTRAVPLDPRGTPRATAVVALSRGIFDAGTRVLTLPAEAGDNLRLEAQRMLSDTTRVAADVVRGLPAPLRARLQQM